MRGTKFVCLIFVSLLVAVFVSCQVGFSAETITLDDLPDSGEFLTITSDSTLTIAEGEAGFSEGVLTIQGTNESTPVFEIVDNGNLTIKNTVTCNTANLTIQNNGNLTLEDVAFTLNSHANLTITNNGTCTIADTNIQVYGGLVYLFNNEALTANNWYIKDQFDGTFIANYGNATLSECTFVSNGAEGKIELFNSGSLQITHGVFDVNYGGTVNMNSLTGTLAMAECNMDVSGSSHGKKSYVNILADNATWENCSFVNNAGTINYLNTGEVNVTNCTVNIYGENASTILSSNGPMTFQNFMLSGDGSTSITNWDSMSLTESSFNSSLSLTLMNNGNLTADNWLVKTLSSAARITVYNGNSGNFTFIESFIEGVERSVLEAVGSEGQEFVESTGGIITVTNFGSLTDLTDIVGISTYLLYMVIAFVAVSLLFTLNRRKTSVTKP